MSEESTLSRNLVPMLIPYQQLSPQALHGLIEEFVTRDGTDYGHTEATLERKVEQVMRHLKSGEIVIVYNYDEEQCNIINKEDAQKFLAK